MSMFDLLSLVFFSTTSKAELAFWVIEYTCILVVFILGIVTPRVSNRAEVYQSLMDESRTHQTNAPATRWEIFKRRTKLLLLLMWPKSRILLQINIVICIAILILSRVVNLYVPMFYRNIGKMVPDCLNAFHFISSQ